MKALRIAIYTSLSCYSVSMIVIEANTSQQFVRNFFTDISGPVPFYAINTSLSVFFLGSTSLMFALCLTCIKDTPAPKKEYYFYISQIFMFAYLCLDDRFMFHEKMFSILGFRGDFFLFALGVLEVIFLILLADIMNQKSKVKTTVFLASFCYLTMFCIDSYVPSNLIFRLSLEDLFKTWSSFFFLLFAWEICCEKIQDLKVATTAELD